MTAILTESRTPKPRADPPGAGRWFYLAGALGVAGVAAYGFSQTIGDGLIHPAIPRPPILYVHATVMCAWLALFITQASLVRAGQVKLHRRLGLFGLGLGAAIPLIGLPTAIVMRRFDIVHLHDTLNFVAVPLTDMVMFAVPFALAILWRRQPDRHRRLMYLATCTLLSAGFGRFPVPDAWFDFGWFYFAIDAMVLAGAGADLLSLRRVHPVYAIGLPLLALAQFGAWLLWRFPPQPWLAALRAVVGAG